MLRLRLCYLTGQLLCQAPDRRTGGGGGQPGRGPLVEAVPRIYRRSRWLRQVLCRSNGAPILDRRRLQIKLCRELPQPRQVPLSPAPRDQIAFRLPLGIIGGIRTGTHGRSLPISAAAAGTGVGRVRTAAARRPLPAATGASILAEFPRSVLWSFGWKVKSSGRKRRRIWVVVQFEN